MCSHSYRKQGVSENLTKFNIGGNKDILNNYRQQESSRTQSASSLVSDYFTIEQGVRKGLRKRLMIAKCYVLAPYLLTPRVTPVVS